jgi:hypothetical protein
MARLAQRPHSTKRSIRAARHFPSLHEDLSPTAWMFTQDVPLAIMPFRARDADTYYAKIEGAPPEVERAIAMLKSLTQSERANIKELVGDAVTEIATSVAWYGRVPYIVNCDDSNSSVRLTSFTPRRLFVTPWGCLQAVPRADRESWKEALNFISRRDLWIVEVPKTYAPGQHPR